MNSTVRYSAGILTVSTKGARGERDDESGRVGAQMLADARNYILKEQWLPVMMPALTLALLALAFEMLGLALRYRDGGRSS